MALGYLNIQLALDSATFQSNLTKAQQKAKQFADRTTQYLGNIEKAANSLNNTNQWARRGLFASIGQQGVKTLINYADSYSELSSRMRLVTDSSTELTFATELVFDIALRTNQSVSATAQTYQRFAKNADRLGISQAEVARLTDTVSKAVAISGASDEDYAALTLTWQGYEFLDKIRNDGVWNKVKSTIKAKGIDLSFDLIKTVSTTAIKSLFD